MINTKKKMELNYYCVLLQWIDGGDQWCNQGLAGYDIRTTFKWRNAMEYCKSDISIGLSKLKKLNVAKFKCTFLNVYFTKAYASKCEIKLWEKSHFQ